MALTILSKPLPKFETKGLNKYGRCLYVWPGRLTLDDAQTMQSVASRRAHGEVVEIKHVEVKVRK